MRLKTITLPLFIFLFAFTSCMSEQEKATQMFLDYAQKVDVKALKEMSTKDTKFYMKMSIETLLNFGDAESIKSLKEIASTIECSVGENSSLCTYIDEAGEKQSFELLFVEGDNTAGEKQLFIQIDKKYFIDVI